MDLPEEFEWDDANKEKNWVKHRVTTNECEEVFFNKPIRITDDPAHSFKEQRFVALGKTHTGRHLFIIFTIRSGCIRIISARNQDKKERSEYAKAQN